MSAFSRRTCELRVCELKHLFWLLNLNWMLMQHFKYYNMKAFVKTIFLYCTTGL